MRIHKSLIVPLGAIALTALAFRLAGARGGPEFFLSDEGSLKQVLVLERQISDGGWSRTNGAPERWPSVSRTNAYVVLDIL
jgi:hypothetical protein